MVLYLLKGGWSQIDELCRATLIYYPRLVIDQCVSWSTFDQLVTETGEKVPGNMTMAHFQNIREWNIDSTRKFKTAFEDSTHKARCSSPKRNPDVCTFSVFSFVLCFTCHTITMLHYGMC